MGEDGVVLEHHADISLMGFQIVDDLVVEADFPAIHAVKPCYHPEQGGLAASGGPQQCKKFALFYLQIHSF